MFITKKKTKKQHPTFRIEYLIFQILPPERTSSTLKQMERQTTHTHGKEKKLESVYKPLNSRDFLWISK